MLSAAVGIILSVVDGIVLGCLVGVVLDTVVLGAAEVLGASVLGA